MTTVDNGIIARELSRAIKAQSSIQFNIHTNPCWILDISINTSGNVKFWATHINNRTGKRERTQCIPYANGVVMSDFELTQEIERKILSVYKYLIKKGLLNN